VSLGSPLSSEKINKVTPLKLHLLIELTLSYMQINYVNQELNFLFWFHKFLVHANQGLKT